MAASSRRSPKRRLVALQRGREYFELASRKILMVMKQDSVVQAETFSDAPEPEPQLQEDDLVTGAKRPRLGVFFSHPTQHHSAMFQYLAKNDDIDLEIFYYDPGLLGGMFDPGYGTSAPWDVDLTSGTRQRVLKNILRGREVHPFRQVNPGVVPSILRGGFDAILISGYASPSNWIAVLAARLMKSAIWYQSDTNILDMQRKETSRLKDFLRRAFFRNVDLFLVAGDNNKAAYRHYGINEDRMVWCPIPVDMARYARARLDPQLSKRVQGLREKYGIPEGALVVAFCGKLIERKRPQDIIEALRIVARRDVYGLLIGSGDMEPSLRRMITAADRIVITGFVNQSEIPYHMLLSDIGVVSSEWDPHPLVTTEFAMCGRPVIVSDYCGVWGDHDILRPGGNGFLYRCGDANELGSQISRLLDDEHLRLSMGQRSLVFAEEQSAEHAAKIVADLLLR
jgi:glycosyltransferase involved in cell wall biosynthesis